MNRLLLLTFVVCLSFSSFVQAQRQVDKKAHFKRVYPVANEQLENNKPLRSVKNFLDLADLDPKNAHINYKIGRSYLLINGKKSEAVPYLEKAVASTSAKAKDSYKETNAPLDAYFYLGRAYHLDSQFDNAIAAYRKYLEVDKSVFKEKKEEVEWMIQTCLNGKLIVESPISAVKHNLGETINSIYDEYSAVVDATESMLIFTSRRPTSTGGLLDLDDKYYEDIFVSQKENGEWTKPVSIGKTINTEGHEATIGLSADGQELYIYRDDFGDGNIYVSQLKGSRWSEPVQLNDNVNSPFRETHATVSADGQTLYFTSDRSGMGGMDIFRSKRLPTGDWAVAENLGEVINTKYDEEAPFIHPDGRTLFFSSKGHSSMGGYDIFFSIEENGKWSTPMNIGSPMNTADDEYFFVMSTDGKRAYYSSSSGEGFGGKDIYLVNLDTDREVPLTVYKGEIVPDKAGKRPKDVTIRVSDNETGELFGLYRPREDNGRFVLILHPGQNYNIAYESDGYLFKSEKLFVPENTAYFEINRAIQLKPVAVNK
ncbi:MAG: PD40 domain-containing protein [Flavobacteriales bacterium]|nr:PD40 domain-containing protein [Flavobacteriales bacterium]MCB9192508.1 PD40 domain-containing protein [Flavobacteriales bacterium]